MRTFLSLILLMAAATAWADDGLPVAKGDWPWWRGPTRDGVADPNQKPPTQWSEKENVVWKTSIPGRGHGSPIVVGDRVLLASADIDRGVQSLLCFDRKTGERKWETIVHTGGLTKAGNGKSSLASSTPASDGERVYINFLNGDAIHTTCLDLAQGKILWQKKVASYVLHQGFGSSPGLYGPLVLVSADNKGTGVIAGLDRKTGEVVWTRSRPKMPNYASPIVLRVAGKDQLLLTGCDLVTSLDPASGKEIWEIPGSTTECVTSTVTDGDRIFTSGGYPKNHVSAVMADGSGKVAWQNGARVYVPSMLAHKGHLFAVHDAGVAVCWKAESGQELWKARLDGNFSASLVLVGDLLYAVNEAGRTFVFKANPEKFERIAENQLGENVLATPAICGGRIYMRVASGTGSKREESLYCLGE